MGYWENDKLNEQSFFNINSDDGLVKRFYKTGDICYLNEDGNLMYVKRKDFQVKIRGFRVELVEIEYHIRNVIDNNISVIDIDSENGNNEIVLVIEGNKMDTNNIFEHLQNNLPNYMIPTKTYFVPELPHNNNGKLDRKQLRIIIEKK